MGLRSEVGIGWGWGRKVRAGGVGIGGVGVNGVKVGGGWDRR